MLKSIENIDNMILSHISSFKIRKVDKLMIYITSVGNNGGIWLVFGFIFLFIQGYRKIGLQIFVSVGLSALMSEAVLKNLVKRSRPCDDIHQKFILIRKPSSYSFPSGHSTSSFAATTTVLLNHGFWSTLSGTLFATTTLLLAITIAFSRLYIRVHYPSDVVAGMFLGISCSLCVLKILTKF
ncbi:MAG: phosphatase PAP2 family protein [Oscillospiraceae bacterium]|jgi:undecaprenyl-diphosphatase|nr:phosphatase PAP2 family protein [Oscillospiraceae bacterium]